MELIQAFNKELGGPVPLQSLIDGMKKVGLDVRDEHHSNFQDYIDANHDGIKISHVYGIGRCFEVESETTRNAMYENVAREICRADTAPPSRPTVLGAHEYVELFNEFIVNETPDAFGYSCANFGTFLSKKGINYPKPLTDYLSRSEAFVVRNSGKGNMRVNLKRRLLEEASDVKSTPKIESPNGKATAPTVSEKTVHEAVIKPNIDNPSAMLSSNIFWWGQEGETDSLRHHLSQIALIAKPELWTIHKENDVLESYLNFTLFKRARRNEIHYVRSCEYFRGGVVDYAVVHTGLFDAQTRKIYMVFRTLTKEELAKRVNNPNVKPWRFECIVVEGVNRRNPLEDNVMRFVKEWPADRMLRKDADALLNEFLEIPHPVPYVMNEMHVIGENFHRLPKNWLDGAAVIAKIPIGGDQKETYLKNPVFVNVFTTLLHNAIEKGLQRIRVDNDLAAYCYNAVFDTVSLLIPISLGGDPDAALAIGKNLSGRYEAFSIFDLKTAYKNARVVRRSLPSWLPDGIKKNEGRTVTPALIRPSSSSVSMPLPAATEAARR